jgi:hypothetical protein
MEHMIDDSCLSRLMKVPYALYENLPPNIMEEEPSGYDLVGEQIGIVGTVVTQKHFLRELGQRWLQKVRNIQDRAPVVAQQSAARAQQAGIGSRQISRQDDLDDALVDSHSPRWIPVVPPGPEKRVTSSLLIAVIRAGEGFFAAPPLCVVLKTTESITVIELSTVSISHGWSDRTERTRQECIS